MPTNVPTTEEFNALEQRVKALEDGAVTPPIDPPIDPPVDGQPSPDGTEATAPGAILMSAALNTFELAEITPAASNYGIKYNGTLDRATHHVSRLYAKGGKIYQEAGGWWYVSNDDGNWSSAMDPTTGTGGGGNGGGIPPQPGDGSRFVSVYTKTRDAQGMWNFGTGNDAALASALEGWARDCGYTPNSYGFFPLWGSMYDWPGNLGWAVKCMNDQNFTKGWTPNVGLKPFWNGVPPAYYEWNDINGLRDTANGVYDDVWKGCVTAVKDAGSTKAIWRLGYEDNFSFMTSFCGWDAESQAEWVRAFERMSDMIMEESNRVGLNSIIAFNPSLGRGSAPVENIIPNPAKFHWFAFDFYNGVYPDEPSDWQTNTATREDFWANMYYGMNHHMDYAKQVGKPVAALETGAGLRPDGHGLDEDAFFWHYSSKAANQARGMGVPYLGAMFWDVPAGDINALFSNNEQPPCQAAVREHLADGTLVGDPQGEVAVATTMQVKPVQYDKAAVRKWVEDHPEFIAAMRKRVEDIIAKARPVRGGKPAAAPPPKSRSK
jgi:hypothetical protein